jgi:class 3 adenylate cyclase
VWLGRAVLVSVALLVLVTTFVAVGWANRLVEPLRRVADRLRHARTDDGGSPPTPGPSPARRAPREYRELSEDIDHMLARLRARGQDLRRRRAERLALLHRFLPPTMADRAEAGEQDVLDRIERASVVVVQLRGVGELLRGSARVDSRDVLGALVDDLDTTARQHGLERFRLSGDSYAAVCGASRPLLDHAPRALAFSRAAREVVAATASAAGAPIAVGVGLASGPVVVGLTGGDRLVFDCWGPTVDRAADLARAAGTGELLVDDAARALLPDEVATTPAPGPRPHGALRVTDESLETGAGT